MQQYDNPPNSSKTEHTRTLPRGVGFIDIRPTLAGVPRYQARWQVKGRWRARTFGTYEEAEAWIRKASPAKPQSLHRPISAPPPARSAESVDLSFVYFIQGVDGGPIKIGIAVDPQARLKALQSASPVLLRILGVAGGGRSAETYLHLKFDHLRLHGEWFQPDDGLLDWIESNATTWERIFGENEPNSPTNSPINEKDGR